MVLFTTMAFSVDKVNLVFGILGALGWFIKATFSVKPKLRTIRHAFQNFTKIDISQFRQSF